MPGTSAATQSSRCGSRPKEPSRVSATMRVTPVCSEKTWNGRRTLRFMSDVGMFDLWFRFCFGQLLHGRGLGWSWGSGFLFNLGFSLDFRLRFLLRLCIIIVVWLGFISRLCFNFCPRLNIWFGWLCDRGGLRFSVRFADRADHVETALRVVLEFVVQDSRS